MFYIIGVGHDVQSKRQSAEDSNDQKEFRKCVPDTIERFKPAILAEEFGEHALEKLRKHTGFEHESITAAVANSLSVEHRYCDPNDDARNKMGYVEGTQLALEISLHSSEGFSNSEISDRGFATEIAKYWPLREKFWLDQLSDVKDQGVVFICGDAHVARRQPIVLPLPSQATWFVTVAGFPVWPVAANSSSVP